MPIDSSDPSRPDPDALLDEARKAGRGRLKVFLGAFPGVGKTYAMLEEAIAKKRAGMDVVVGLVETHGREETAILLKDLEVLPRRPVAYRGQALTELDLDALLARRPALALIDEFAHTNAPGSRHLKRWQDVMEVVDAGIDVVTTLNIQHIESLNDVVARITGIRVQETIPDEIFRRADAIELIDLTPETLIERMQAGKVYVPQQVGRALENFFTKGNLTALRELALRAAASRVDDEMMAWMRSHAVRGPWPTQERLLVCINESNVAKALIRAAKRMADRTRIPWIAVTVVTPKHEALGIDRISATREALTLAESLGGETATLRVESDAANEILAYARRRNVTHIVIGRARRRPLFDWFRESVADKLLRTARDFEITIVAAHPRVERRRALARAARPLSWRAYGAAMLSAVLSTLVAWPVFFWSEGIVGALSVIYLVGILIVGARYGLRPSLLAGVISFLLYNFLFTEPHYTLYVSSSAELAALLVFLLGAIFTGSLAGRLKAQVETMRAAQRRTEQLYDFGRKISAATKADDVLWAAAAHLAATLDGRSLILMPDATGRLAQVQGYPSIEEDIDARAEAAARWAFEKNEPAGTGTATLPAADWLFVPMTTAKATLGVVGVQFRDARRSTDPEILQLLSAVEDQIAIAVERLSLASELEKSRVKAEGERLRTALLASVSHDLRTPLVTIIGGLTAISEDGPRLSPVNLQALGQEALGEARRLDRYVQNLLDMTRLGYGALAPHFAIVDLREIVGRARADLARSLSRHRIAVDIPKDLPRLNVDPVLIGQALVNVLENACKYAPIDSTIRIEARSAGDFVALAIRDEGPGIPAADREKIFDLFYRVARGDNQPAGTGLGLAIVKGLVEAHGGAVRALANEGGAGTKIEIDLPIAETRPEIESGE